MSTTRRSRKAPLVLKGSLFTFVRRCGKPSCHCADGDGHASPALSYVENGKTKTLTLTGVDLDEVRAALGRYDTARADLDAAAADGITELRAQQVARRARS